MLIESEVNMICEACKFWEQGQCRKHIPVCIRVKIPESQKSTPQQTNTHIVTRWPETKSWEGCGEGE